MRPKKEEPVIGMRAILQTLHSASRRMKTCNGYFPGETNRPCQGRSVGEDLKAFCLIAISSSAPEPLGASDGPKNLLSAFKRIGAQAVSTRADRLPEKTPPRLRQSFVLPPRERLFQLGANRPWPNLDGCHAAYRAPEHVGELFLREKGTLSRSSLYRLSASVYLHFVRRSS